MEHVWINELPNFLAEDPYEKTNLIIVNDPLNPNEPLIIPLMLKGSLVLSCPGSQEQVRMKMSLSRILT